MPIVQPPKERHTIQDDGAALRITIPSRKQVFFMFFIGFWLIGWAIGEIFAGGMVIAGVISLLSGTPAISEVERVGLTGGGLFMLAWLGIWTVAGGGILYAFLWQLIGKEIVEVSYEGIKIQRAVGRLGRKKEYLASHIKELRVAPLMMDASMFGWTRMGYLWGMSGGLIAFDYGAQTFRFGAGVDEAEAKHILEKITARFPQYRTRVAEVE
jgi:hypothetical protein